MNVKIRSHVQIESRDTDSVLESYGLPLGPFSSWWLPTRDENWVEVSRFSESVSQRLVSEIYVEVSVLLNYSLRTNGFLSSFPSLLLNIRCDFFFVESL